MSSYMPKAESIGEIKSNFVEMAIDNEVTNGDFSDDFANWIASGNTAISTSEFHSSGKSAYKYTASDALYRDVIFPNGHEIFCCVYIKSDVGARLKINEHGTWTPLDYGEIVSGDWKLSHTTVIATNGGIRIDETLSSDGEHYFDDFIGVDKTELGIEDYSEEVMLKLVQQGYFESCNVIAMADDYFAASYDDNEILFTDGKPNLLQVDKLANITNNQLFVSLDKQKIMFYETPLTGDCLYKACKALKLNEPYMVQTAEGSGEYEPYITADGMLYVLKEGVTVSR